MNNMNVPSCKEFFKGCEEFKKHEKRDAMYKVATFLVSHFWSKYSEMANGLGVLLLTWNQAFYRYGSFNFEKLEECINKNFQKIEKFRDIDISSFSENDEDKIKCLFEEFLEALQIDIIKFSDKHKKRYTKQQLEEILKAWKINYNGIDLESIYTSMKKNQKIKNAVEFDKSNEKNKKLQITISELSDAEKKCSEIKKLIPRSPVAVAKALHLLAPNFFPLWDDKIAQAYGCHYKDNSAEKYISFCKITKRISDKVKDYVVESDKTIVKLIDEYNYSRYTKGWI